jgi:F1F0 ATPase subunit 2
MTGLFVPFILGFSIGSVVGGLFFASMWWTTRRLVRSRRPIVILVVGTLSRLVVVGCVLTALAMLAPGLLVGALVGFVLVRTLAVRRVLSDAGADQRPVVVR